VKNRTHTLSSGLSLALTIAFVCGPISFVRRAAAAVVSGSFVYRNGSPAKDRQLHLENRASGDMFVAPCNADGTFSADVPPGLYDLQAERGVVLKNRIQVEDEPINVGRVVEPVPLDVYRLFQRQTLAEAIVKSPAPATANMTGRPIQAMQFGNQAAERYGAPVGTPASTVTPGAKGVEGMSFGSEAEPPTQVEPVPPL
jgi:hypothetical protein